MVYVRTGLGTPPVEHTFGGVEGGPATNTPTPGQHCSRTGPNHHPRPLSKPLGGVPNRGPTGRAAETVTPSGVRSGFGVGFVSGMCPVCLSI